MAMVTGAQHAERRLLFVGVTSSPVHRFSCLHSVAAPALGPGE